MTRFHLKRAAALGSFSTNPSGTATFFKSQKVSTPSHVRKAAPVPAPSASALSAVQSGRLKFDVVSGELSSSSYSENSLQLYNHTPAVPIPAANSQQYLIPDYALSFSQNARNPLASLQPFPVPPFPPPQQRQQHHQLVPQPSFNPLAEIALPPLSAQFSIKNLLQDSTTWRSPYHPASSRWSIRKPNQQERTGLIDAFSFYFKEQDIDNNMIEIMQDSSHYHERLAESYPYKNNLPDFSRAYIIMNFGDHAQKINAALFKSDAAKYLPPEELSRYARIAFDRLEHPATILHRPTFNINSCSIPLAAALVYLGMVTTCQFKRDLEPVFESVAEVAVSEYSARMRSHSLRENLDCCQAMAILAFYNYWQTRQDNGFTLAIDKMCNELSKYILLGGVLHDKAESELNLGNAIVNSDAYTFFVKDTPAELEEQWLTWIRHESLMRVAHFCHFAIKIQKYACQHPDFPSDTSSLGDYDFAMICPPALWKAFSTDMFFHTLGSTRSIITISYLLTLKCMLRLPSMSDNGARQFSMKTIEGKSGWSGLHLYIVMYGLAAIGWVVEGCCFYQQMYRTQKLLEDDPMREVEPGLAAELGESDTSDSTVSIGRSNMFADRHVRSRLFSSVEVWAEFCETSAYEYLRQDFDVMPVNGKYKPCFLWMENDNIHPWDSLTCLSIHFQTSYFSIYYREDQFEGKLVQSVFDHLVLLAAQPDYQSWSAAQVETFVMFGTHTPTEDQVNILTSWIKKDLSLNKMFIVTVYLITVLKSSTPARFGGAEVKFARALLVPACLIAWAFDFQRRFVANAAYYTSSVTHTDYYRNCIHHSSQVDPTSILSQHFKLAQDGWRLTRGLYVNPTEQETANLVSKLRKSKQNDGWSRAGDIEVPDALYPNNEVFEGTTSADGRQRRSSSVGTSNSSGSGDTPEPMAPCTIFSFFGLMCWVDEVKLKLDAGMPDNEILAHAKAVF